MPTVDVNGVDMYYEIRGNGAPLVMIPGLGADARQFAYMAPDLESSCRLLMLDPRGSGRTQGGEPDTSVESMAEDVAVLARAVDFAPAHMLGYSLGGRVALALAVREPELVKSLVLVSSSARTVLGTHERVRRFAVERFARVGLARASRKTSAYSGQRRAWLDDDCSSLLHQIRVPTLVLQARDDEVVSSVRAAELRDGIPGSRLVSFPGGHTRFIEPSPGSIVSDIREFVLSAD